MRDPLLEFVILFSILTMCVVMHEVSHGWVALRLGDTTALRAGRLTLNPLRHVDPMGTVILPLLLLLLRSPILFGWAKPVPVNATNMANPKRDMLWVGAAGPATNFLLAVFGTILLRIFGEGGGTVAWGFSSFVLINVLLGVFNILPIPPLDGSRVLTGLLPNRYAVHVLRLEPWGMPILLLLFTFGFFKVVVTPIVALALYFLSALSGARFVFS